MTSPTRRSVTSAAVAMLALGALVPVAGSAGASGRDGSSVSGAGVSRLPEDTRRLALDASTDGAPTEAAGQLQFSHHGPNGLARFTAAVDCLDVGADGVVEVSGLVRSGQNSAGDDLSGKAVAFTLDVGEQQSFTLPRFGDPEPCSGGRAETVDVTHGGFRAS